MGKVALLRGVHQLRNPSGHFRVIDAAEAGDSEAWLDMLAEELSAGGGTLVLRRVDVLEPEVIQELSVLLMDASARHGAGDAPWVAMTLNSLERNARVDTELVPYFAHSVEVPPLRHHLEDLGAIAQHLLGRGAGKGAVSLSSAAMSQLMRLPWRGNVEQLRRVLEQVTQQRQMGIINVDDLPAECRATGRRQLTKMGALERDAISASLAMHQGDKGRTAEHLGISRATIYRKLREYGITWKPDRGGSK